jgi:hypothetical protein
LPWIATAPLVACGSTVDGEPTATSASPIYGGVEDNTNPENPAVVALAIGNNGTTFLLCSGVLIAPNVVMTARHCVSTQTSTQISCDQNGVSANPPDFGADVAANTINVFTGATPALLSTPASTGTAIFHPPGTTLCNLDMALVVLGQPITGVAPLQVRLTGAVTTAESVRTVGYGENDQNAPLGTRFRKDGLSVLAVGSTISASMTPLGSNEFELGESMCQGDSGGPAIDEKTGAVVGIVSRGGACTDPAGHVYTATSGFASVFQQAFAMAGGAPIAEGTAPALDAGSGPTQDPDGSSGVTPAPTSTTPTDAPRENAPLPVNLHAGQGQGCSFAASPTPSEWATAALVSLLATLAAARRRVRLAVSSSHGGRR